MFEVRVHGRGGQGVVTAAELLSVAAFAEGRYAQAFPSFGSERTGAPVAAYCRIDRAPIRLREPVLSPDAVIVQDSTLLHAVDVFDGLAADGHALINTRLDWAQLDIPRRVPRDRVLLVPATQLALAHIGRPVPNAALLGGFAAMTGLVSLAAVTTAIRQRFRGGLAEGNAAAASAAYEHVVARVRARVDA
jgi:pyruvate ferredoxin oxidoreductase gamma subunit